MALLGEMRRRNIFKVSLAYMITAWLIIQIADVLFPTFGAPPWVMQVLVLGLILMFPIAVLLSWAFELTPEGFKATADVDKTQSITITTGRKLNHIVTGLLGTAVVFLVIDNYVLVDTEPPEIDVAYRRTIAVLPFDNRSAAEEDAEFLADGIHDELLSRLAQISDLSVISRTSVLTYRDTTSNIREIGAALGAGSVLEGSVQRSGDSVRIIMQLIDAQTDEHIWADTYDTEITAANIFSIQAEISTAIAGELQAQLDKQEESRIQRVPTESMQALEAYFAGKRALARRDGDSLRAAMTHFERAVDIDPQFALPWSGLVEAWLELANYEANADADEIRLSATAAANRAIALDPESPNVLAAYGWQQLLHYYDWRGAEASFEAALAIDASNSNALHWYSHLLSWQGKHDAAIEIANRALTSDPFSILMATNLSFMLADARHWDEAFQVGDETLAKEPYSSLMANLWIANLRARRAVEAAVQLENWASATGRDVEAAKVLGAYIVRVQSGEETDPISQELLQRLNIRAQLPDVYAAIGDAEMTLAALADAQKTGIGFRSLLSMRINPSFDFIREDPRYTTLMARIGLSDN